MRVALQPRNHPACALSSIGDVGDSNDRRWSGRGRKKCNHARGMPPSQPGNSGGGLTPSRPGNSGGGPTPSQPGTTMMEPGLVFRCVMPFAPNYTRNHDRGLLPGCNSAGGTRVGSVSWALAGKPAGDTGQRDATRAAHNNRVWRERRNGPAGNSGRYLHIYTERTLDTPPPPPPPRKQVKWLGSGPDAYTFNVDGHRSVDVRGGGGSRRRGSVKSMHSKLPKPADKDPFM